MSEQYRVRSDRGWGLVESVVMIVALVGFATTWALFVTAPPDGLVSPLGIVVSVAAGAYLTFLVYSYLKYLRWTEPRSTTVR